MKLVLMSFNSLLIEMFLEEFIKAEYKGRKRSILVTFNSLLIEMFLEYEYVQVAKERLIRIKLSILF